MGDGIRESAGGDWKTDINAFIQNGMFVFQNKLFSFERIPLSEIERFDVVTEENKASIAGKLGWGAVGAVALGPLGLLAGVLGGGNRQERLLSISFKDGRKVLVNGNAGDAKVLATATFT